jgi:hypothetical protein
MKPIVPHKYNIGLVVHNCTYDLLTLLEPWCDNIYFVDEKEILKNRYIADEQKNTKFNLKERICTQLYQHVEPANDIILEFKADMFSQQSYSVIQNFSEWLEFYEPTPGDYEADIFKIKINKVETYENNLIVCQKQ